MEINNFLKQFNFFYDSVIRRVGISFRNGDFTTNVEVIISTRDSKTVENDSWVNVAIKISEVTEFNFRESSKESYQIISDGLHILESEKSVYFDFGFYSDAPKNSEEIQEIKFLCRREKF